VIKKRPVPSNPHLSFIEQKISNVRQQQRDATSPEHASRCAYFIDQLLERWLKISDEDQARRLLS